MTSVNSVKIRMYRHGFGDCFLLRFFSDNKLSCSMLIDCGLKKNDSVPGVTLDMVKKDIAGLLNPQKKDKIPLDILVITHEHWDHVSAFLPKDQRFDDLSIGQLWMAWTEDPDDKDAKILNKGLEDRIKALQLAGARLKKSAQRSAATFKNIYNGDKLQAAREEFHTSLEEVMAFMGPVGLTKTPGGISVKDKYTISMDTQKAMDHIRSIAAGRDAAIRYCNPGELLDNITLLPGVRIYVLGPPKNKLLNKDAPSAGGASEVYFGNNSLAGFVDGVLRIESDRHATDDTDSGKPFGRVASFSADAKEPWLTQKDGYRDPKCAWRTIEDDWLDMAGALAMQMDSDTNNTSLALAIEFAGSGKVLLFPGDAQVGNWLSWHDQSWTVKDGNKTKAVKAADLLNKTVFYKVGHHSSHNATLKEKGLEMMTDPDLVAFVPEKNDQYNGIPYKPLLESLRKKTKGRLIYSADKNIPAEGSLKKRPASLSAKEWKEFTDAIELKPLYVEYTLKS